VVSAKNVAADVVRKETKEEEVDERGGKAGKESDTLKVNVLVLLCVVTTGRR